MILRTNRQLARHVTRSLENQANTSRSCLYAQNCWANGPPLQNIATLSQARAYATPPTPSSDPRPESVIQPASPPPGPRDLRSQIDPSPPPPPGQKRKRRIGPIILAAGCLMLGLTAGQWVRFTISPPELPEPGTEADRQLAAYIRGQAERLPFVKRLEENPEWEAWDAYSVFTEEQRKQRITTGPLSGVRGVGAYQRVFHNELTGEFINVIWIGGALAGFPGVCHGGLIATIVDESIGRSAISTFAGRTGVTANLELKYNAPVLTNSFYVIRSKPVEEGSSDRKRFAIATVESLEGRVFVEAKALFVVPKKVELRRIDKPVTLHEGRF